MSGDELADTLAETVRFIRHRARVSQRELAEHTGTSAAFVARLERGMLPPAVANLIVVLEAGGFSLAVVAPQEVCAEDRAQVPEQRDVTGRRFPAHADERAIRFPHHWWFVRHAPTTRASWPAYTWRRPNPWFGPTTPAVPLSGPRPTAHPETAPHSP